MSQPLQAEIPALHQLRKESTDKSTVGEGIPKCADTPFTPGKKMQSFQAASLNDSFCFVFLSPGQEEIRASCVGRYGGRGHQSWVDPKAIDPKTIDPEAMKQAVAWALCGWNLA